MVVIDVVVKIELLRVVDVEGGVEVISSFTLFEKKLLNKSKAELAFLGVL